MTEETTEAGTVVLSAEENVQRATATYPGTYANGLHVMRDTEARTLRLSFLEQTPSGVFVRGVFVVPESVLDGIVAVKAGYDEADRAQNAHKKKMN